MRMNASYEFSVDRCMPDVSGGRSLPEVLDSLCEAVNNNAMLILLTGQTASIRNHILQKLGPALRASRAEYCLLNDEYASLETEEELYQGLAKGFCLEEKPFELLEDLVERVEHFIEVAMSEKKLIVVSGNNSDAYATGVLAALLQLASSHKGLCLVLAGEESLLDSINAFHTQSFSHCHINLADFSGDEVVEFSSAPVRAIRKPAMRLPDGLSIQHLSGMAIAILFTVVVVLFYPHENMNTENVSVMQSPEPVGQVLLTEPVMPNSEQPINVPVEPGLVHYSDQERFLLGQRSDDVALQLAILSSEQSASEFIAEQEAAQQQQLHYYQRGRDEKIAWVVVYGSYPDKATALEVLDTLPPSLRKGSPWPRPFADIQQDIRNRTLL